MAVLKTRIHEANRPVFSSIFEMSEMKSMIKALRGVDCTSGLTTRGRFTTESIDMEAKISRKAMDEFIAMAEKKIENLQELLETHNANCRGGLRSG